jgi:hypothetical protein
MGEDPNRDWMPQGLQPIIPNGWPSGTADEIESAMASLARSHMIWDGEIGYRVTPPPGTPSWQ